MKKPSPDTGTATAAQLISWAIDHFTRHPDLRRKEKITLSDLIEAGKVRRRLITQVNSAKGPSPGKTQRKVDEKVLTARITFPNDCIMDWYRNGQIYQVKEVDHLHFEVVEGDYKGWLIRQDHTDLSD
ncbi:hypothetical protein [Fibrella forsythiae]|uniref:Uncharacterized protein n=1 Tax=Fibrella forsythiae TaxID=2817061 RepID=A0ABS3JBG5_9BACT|nr:hypothetical protein [Fibrella forsythiae]MBO0947332.1 hypothetical protein [Fibrella forsythiae]